MTGVDAPEACGTIQNFPAVDAGVIHAFRRGEQAWRRLELAIGSEWHPVTVEYRGVWLAVLVHGDLL
ncbi:hypothetical protein D3C71_2149120 [compost metagenome]